MVEKSANTSMQLRLQEHGRRENTWKHMVHVAKKGWGVITAGACHATHPEQQALDLKYRRFKEPRTKPRKICHTI